MSWLTHDVPGKLTGFSKRESDFLYSYDILESTDIMYKFIPTKYYIHKKDKYHMDLIIR